MNEEDVSVIVSAALAKVQGELDELKHRVDCMDTTIQLELRK